MTNSTNTYFRDEDDALCTTINGVTEYHSSELSIMDVAAANGLTRDDFTHIG